MFLVFIHLFIYLQVGLKCTPSLVISSIGAISWRRMSSFSHVGCPSQFRSVWFVNGMGRLYYRGRPEYEVKMFYVQFSILKLAEPAPLHVYNFVKTRLIGLKGKVLQKMSFLHTLYIIL